MKTKSIAALGGAILVSIVTIATYLFTSLNYKPLKRSEPAAISRPQHKSEDPNFGRSGMLARREPSAPVELENNPQQGAPKETFSQELASEPEEDDAVQVTTPVAFLDHPSLVIVEFEQNQTIQAVRNSFQIAMLKAGNPSSPEYLDRWLVEQDRADELLKAYLGPEDFSKFHGVDH